MVSTVVNEQYSSPSGRREGVSYIPQLPQLQHSNRRRSKGVKVEKITNSASFLDRHRWVSDAEVVVVCAVITQDVALAPYTSEM